jgi:succinate dehydrogenase hydrophobic anchor subunit
MKYRLEILLKSQIITDYIYKVMTQTSIAIAVLAASLLTGVFATTQMV